MFAFAADVIFTRRYLTVAAAIALLLAPLIGCQHAARPDYAAFDREEWRFDSSAGLHIQTPHFDIYSTVSDRAWLNQLAGYLETCYQSYADLVPPDESKTNRMTTYLFETRSDWEHFTTRQFPRRAGTYRLIRAGGFSEGSIGVCYVLRDRGYTMAVLAHEGTHQYLALNQASEIPAWLNEGMATYCEVPPKRAGGWNTAPSSNFYRINDLREAVASRNLLPLVELLATDAGEVLRGAESRRTRTYYAQSWGLIMYLLHGENGRYRSEFTRALHSISNGSLQASAQSVRLGSPSPSTMSPGEAVLRAIIDVELPQFEDGYVAYLRNLAGLPRTGGN